MTNVILWPLKRLQRKASANVPTSHAEGHSEHAFPPQGNASLKTIIQSDISQSTKRVIWIHVDSRIEYEFVSPIIRRFAHENQYTILLTYSGSANAFADYNCFEAWDAPMDYIFQLPANTISNATLFFEQTKPSMAIFVSLAKHTNYYWLLSANKIPTFLITPNTFSEDSSLFTKWYSISKRNALRRFTHIFATDVASCKYLHTIGITNSSYTGNPLIDEIRTKCLPKPPSPRLSIIEQFTKNSEHIFIGGNIDLEQDLRRVAQLVNTDSSIKCILFPRIISEETLNRIKAALNNPTVCYSECDTNSDFKKVQTLVIDFLTSAEEFYRYGTFAYIGSEGFFNSRQSIAAMIHGLPIAFGARSSKQPIPKVLVERGIAQIVRGTNGLRVWGNSVKNNPILSHKAKVLAYDFTESHIGAVENTFSHIIASLI
ncbi:MAG: 3-deoxy-D-manno-octulosonic acid transferase [Bacteroidaceae bacterium]